MNVKVSGLLDTVNDLKLEVRRHVKEALEEMGLPRDLAPCILRGAGEDETADYIANHYYGREPA